MQDCEDVIHPLCYRLFNWLIPRKDMVQLPVMALEPKWYQLTSGHYIDEFAQLHYKDLVVREMLSRSIPAAGVGCAFSRRAMEVVSSHNGGHVFSVDSLTEDYDFGFRLKQYGLKQVFVRFPISVKVTKRHWCTGREQAVRQNDLVCIREFFPAGLRASIKQKSRWVVGITLQGWENLGWMSGLWTRYMLYRDRKSLLTNLVNILGYLVVIAVLAVWLTLHIDPDAYRYPPLLERDSWLWYVIIANACLLLWRIAWRAFCVQRLYGPRQALLSLPRMVWGNLINFFATCRAIRLYVNYLKTGKPIGWDKTAHVFPDEAALSRYRRKLGELLLEGRAVDSEALARALERQRAEPRPLGQILKEMGVLSDEQLALALQRQ
jgi:adsorption protein B